ncbi:hypothetical protein CVS54_01370 [Microbacterium oxydans]|uniref:Uncharacterized protein n=1 Tax=Microbacterium oxydans TaxID=82380 RepID=A0A3S9WIZ8_9MICO|nr:MULTISPECIES: hypothetical protein [Microbacterium]AZS40048.1 hypothetical protein CVS54_01370 [Microbacterium oxydans]
MSSELATVAADLQTFLEAEVPTKWKVINAETLGTSKTTGVVVTWEQLDLSQIAEDQKLPEGWLWVTFQIVISVPETDATKAMPRLTKETGVLLQIFDASPELRWGPDATRTRLETGESAFVIPLAVLASNNPPTATPAP